MQSSIALLQDPKAPDSRESLPFDLDELSGRLSGGNASKASVTLGSSPEDTISLPEFALSPQHLLFEWLPRSSTWSIKNQGSNGSVSVNSSPLNAGETRTLAMDSCLISAAGAELWFARTPAPPEFRGRVAKSIEIPSEGLVIGRGDAKGDPQQNSDPKERRPKLSLDPEIFTISSRQAEIVWKDGGVVLANLHRSGKFRTKLNGNQNFDRQILVFGDCLQIPGYEYYTFQFDGRSLVHIGDEGILQARGLKRIVGDGKQILSDVDIDIHCGEFVGVLGGSGQGKSTLMNAVCAIAPATSGTVRLDGRKLASASDIADEAIGYVPQDDIVHGDLKVREALEFGARLRLKLSKRQLSQAIDGVLQTLGLVEHQHKPIKILSGGQRKRVSIASELLTNPRFIFLDEPTSGLDPQTESDLMSELSVLARNKRMGIFCTTHVLQNSHLFSSIVFVHGGRIVFHGRPIEAVRYFLLARPFDPEAGGSTSTSMSSPGASGSSATSGARDSSGVFAASPTGSAQVSEDELLAKLPKVYGEMDRMSARGEPAEVAKRMQEVFEESEFKRALTPLKTGDPSARSGSDRRNAGRKARQKERRKRPGFFKTLAVLNARQWRLLVSDRLNLVFLMAQALAIGALVGWVDDNLVFQMFIAVIATLWFGCSNGAQQIVGELAIFRRERLAGIGLNAYLLSKLGFVSLVTSVQAILLFATILGTHHLSHPEILPVFGEPDREQNRKAFAESFFNNRIEFMRPALGSTSSRPGAAAPSEGFVDVSDFMVMDASGSELVPDQTIAHFMNPTGLRAYDGQFRILEEIAWFFRLRENIIDELGVHRIEVPHDAVPEADGDRNWIGFVSLLIALRVGGLLAAAVVGVALGLAVSALVRTPTQAVMWVPLILIPQILFGSFVVTAPEMNRSVREFSAMLPSFNLQRLQDVANLYGRRAPRITNKTKVPAFFAAPPYEEDTVRWRNRKGEQMEKYDRVSEVSKSWQNLVVISGVVGERHKVGSSESVTVRRDVLFPEGFSFRLLGGATTSWMVLGFWLAGSYIVVLIGLKRKEIG